MARRDKIDIMGEILGISRNGARKTQIMNRVGMSSIQTNYYLSFLTDKELLRKNGNGGKPIYETTDKGRKFIDNYKEAKSLLA